jgi:hypothetical protein
MPPQKSEQTPTLLLLLATGWKVDDVWKLDNKVELSENAARFFFRGKRK